MRFVVSLLAYGWIWPVAAREWIRNSILASAVIAVAVTVALVHLPAALLSSTYGPGLGYLGPPSFLDAFLQAESIIATAIIAYGVLALNIMYDRLFARDASQTLPSFIESRDASLSVYRALESSLSLWRQLLTIIVFGAVTAATLGAADMRSRLAFWVGSPGAVPSG